MENKLPEHIQKLIDQDAENYSRDKESEYSQRSVNAHRDGATGWAQQCQQMAEALEEILVYCEESGVKRMAVENPVHMAIYHSLHTAKNALASWKEEGKEGGGK